MTGVFVQGDEKCDRSQRIIFNFLRRRMRNRSYSHPILCEICSFILYLLQWNGSLSSFEISGKSWRGILINPQIMSLTRTCRLENASRGAHRSWTTAFSSQRDIRTAKWPARVFALDRQAKVGHDGSVACAHQLQDSSSVRSTKTSPLM